MVRACFETDCETAVVGLGITMAKLVSSDGNKVLFLSVGSADDTALLCEGFSSISDLVYFDVIGDGEKRIEITLLGVGGDPDDYEACFGGEIEFTQDGGTSAGFDGNFWVGILPDCTAAPTGPGPHLPADDAPVTGPPCVESRTLDVPTGDVTLVIVAPPGDPLVKIG